MATNTEQVIVDLLIREQGLVQVLNSAKDVEEFVIGLTALGNKAELAGASFQELRAGVSAYNTEVEKARTFGSFDLPMVGPQYMKQIPDVAKAQESAGEIQKRKLAAEQLAAEQLKREQDAQAAALIAEDIRMGKLQARAELENQARDARKAQEQDQAAMDLMNEDLRMGRLQARAEIENAAFDARKQKEAEQAARNAENESIQMGKIQARAELENQARDARKIQENDLAVKSQMEEDLRMGRLQARAEIENAAFDKQKRDAAQIAATEEMAADQKMGKLKLQAEAEYDAEQRRLFALQEQAAKENHINSLLASRRAELQAISKLKPADQVAPLAKLLQGEIKNGLTDVGQLTKRWQTDFGISGETIKKVTQEVRNLQNGMGGMLKEAFSLQSVMNTAFGVGMAMVIFQLQMLVTKFFTDTIQQVKDLQTAISNLIVVEAAMSRAGVEVTGRDLLNIVSELEKKFVNISNTDMLKATGDMGMRLADKGVTPEELQKIMEATILKKISRPDKTLDEVQGLMASYILTGEKESVKGLGLAPTDDDIQAWGVTLGLAKDMTDELTDQEKVHARIAYVNFEVQRNAEDILATQGNLANAADRLSAVWENLTARSSGLVDTWNAFLYVIAEALNTAMTIADIFDILVNDSYKINGTYRDDIGLLAKAIDKLKDFLLQTNLIWQTWKLIKEAYEFTSGKKMEDQPTVQKLAAADTPTGIPSGQTADESEKNADKIRKAMVDLAEAMDEFGDRARKMEEDFATSMKKLEEDWIETERRFREDWANDRARIETDANNDIAEKTAKHQNDLLDREAKFQEKLRQLKERYLMDLDDALHTRDARQVLRLMREYAMNKTNLTNEHALETQTAEQQHLADIARLEQERDNRLAILDAERALRLARMDYDYKLDVSRKNAQHKVEMARLEAEKQDRLRKIANSLSEQLKLTAKGAQAIYDIFSKYFGENGIVGKTVKYTYEQIAAYAGQMTLEIAKINGMYQQQLPVNTASPLKPATLSPMQQINLMGAMSPTSYLPTSSSVQSGSVAVPRSGTTGDRLEVVVSLGRDLEGRIVNQSLKAVSSSIKKATAV